jgi:hypothetical protein
MQDGPRGRGRSPSDWRNASRGFAIESFKSRTCCSLDLKTPNKLDSSAIGLAFQAIEGVESPTPLSEKTAGDESATRKY